MESDWETFGGLIGAGESLSECIARECSPYIPADVDNGGTVEYFRIYYCYPASYHQGFYLVCSLYSYRDGEFGKILFDGIIEDLMPECSFLW